MYTRQPQKKTGTESTVKLLRRMGMMLCVVGSIILAAGLMFGLDDTREDLLTRFVLTLFLGASLFISGLFLWRSP